MLPKILTAITRNTRTISTQMFFITHLNQARNSSWNLDVLKSKMRVFQAIRIISISYLIMILIVFGIRLIVVWYLNWVVVCANEALILLMVLAAGIILGPNELVYRRDSLGDSSNALIALVNLMERGELDEQDFENDDGSGDGVPLVNFGDHVNDVSELIVFQYPSVLTTADLKGKKSLGETTEGDEEDSKKESKEQHPEDENVQKPKLNGDKDDNSVKACLAVYPLSLGALEKFKPKKTEENEKKSEKKKKTKKRNRRNRNGRRNVSTEEEEGIELESIVSNNNGNNNNNNSSGDGNNYEQLGQAPAEELDDIDLERGTDENGALLRH